MNNFIIPEINTLAAIPDFKFSGYFWISDKDKPEMLFEEIFPKDRFGKAINPFCIEALLYSESEQISIHIKHTGSYSVSAYDHKQFGTSEIKEKTYLPHKLENVQKVIFKQIWEEVPLEEGSDMMTLKPTALIFSGFKF